MPKNRRLCLQHTKSQARAKNQTVVFVTHELAKSPTCAKNQAVVFAAYDRPQTHEHTILRKIRKKKCGACVCCIKARSHELKIFPEKGVLGLFATTNQLAKSEKIKSFMSSWLEAKISLLFLYFQSVQVTNLRTRDCWLEFVSSCVHIPNRLSLNLFRTN